MGEIVIYRDQQEDLDPYLNRANARLTFLEIQDLVMHAYKLGRIHGETERVSE